MTGVGSDVLAADWDLLVERVEEVAATGDRRARGILRDMLKHERAGRVNDEEEVLCRLECTPYMDGGSHAPARNGSTHL